MLGARRISARKSKTFYSWGLTRSTSSIWQTTTQSCLPESSPVLQPVGLICVGHLHLRATELRIDERGRSVLRAPCRSVTGRMWPAAARLRRLGIRGPRFQMLDAQLQLLKGRQLSSLPLRQHLLHGANTSWLSGDS